ncbi:MAG TPA: hypothetical protein VF266_11120 [Thermoanaerobaculia bacterium]
MTAALALFIAVSVAADDVPLRNWTVASPSKSRVAAHGDVSKAAVFVAIAPCRLLDTRYPNGPFAGPTFTPGAVRTFNVPAGGCGVPNAAAYSVNFTLVNYVGTSGYITAFPAGGTPPGVSTVNFGSGLPINNAAIVPTTNGSFEIYATGTTDVIADMNGYFLDGDDTLLPNNYLGLAGNVGNSGVIYGVNQTATSGAYTSGVFGTLSSTILTDGAGVVGVTNGGTTWGVKGVKINGGADSGGVLGVTGSRIGTGIGLQRAGVRGESPVHGVLGVTDGTGVNGGWGVTGAYVSGGVLGPTGYVGGPVYAVLAQGDFAATGTKSFLDPHPHEAGKVIRFVALEGPEAGTYFRGRGRFVKGRAVIDVPEAFRFTSEEAGMTVHVTPIGGLAVVGVMKQSLERIEVEASRDVEFSYVVYGVRRGYRDFQPIVEGSEFRPRPGEDRIPAHLNDEQKRRLIENGTYNSDGTVNRNTAMRLGWEID